MNIKNSQVFHALVNKRFVIICLLIFCVGTLWTTGILGQIGDAVEYTVKGLGKAFKYMNDALSAYNNALQIIEDLKTDLKDLESQHLAAKGYFSKTWQEFKFMKSMYETYRSEFWDANSDFNDAENRRIAAIGDKNAAEARIKYCNTMLDAAAKRSGSNGRSMTEYWKNEKSKAENELSDAESRESSAIDDKKDAEKRFNSARGKMYHWKTNKIMWEEYADSAKQRVDDIEYDIEIKEFLISAQTITAMIAEILYEKADEEYKAYKAGLDKQNQNN